MCGYWHAIIYMLHTRSWYQATLSGLGVVGIFYSATTDKIASEFKIQKRYTYSDDPIRALVYTVDSAEKPSRKI